jgi:hypothetical protein
MSVLDSDVIKLKLILGETEEVYLQMKWKKTDLKSGIDGPKQKCLRIDPKI